MRRTNPKILSVLLILAMLLSLFPTIAFAAGDASAVVINESAFPDAIFRSYVAGSFDADHDNSLSHAEMAR